MAGLVAGTPLLSGAPAETTNYWNLEADTVVPIHTTRGATGTCTLKKGTRVQLILDSPGKLTLEFAGERFEMPKGAALQEAMQKLNPKGTPPEKLVFDARRWMRGGSTQEGGNPKQTENGGCEPETFRTVPDPLPFDKGDTKIPDGFTWDRTVIIPGKFAFLNIPFIKETKAGTCVGASSINVVRYLKPEYLLSNPEHFRLITGREA